MKGKINRCWWISVAAKCWSIFIVGICVLAVFSGNCLAVTQAQKQRIISLAPAVTEIIFSLGAGKQVVGVTTFCDYPHSARDKEKIGTFSQPNIEKIILLNPDIIFATGLEQEFTVTKLKQLGFKVCISDPSNMQELFDSIKEIGTVLDRDKEAETLIVSMKERLEQVKKKVSLISIKDRPKVFIEIWNDPLMTAAKESFINQLVEFAGGVNIAGDVSGEYSYFSAERVIYCDPECIIFSRQGDKRFLDSIKRRIGWKEIKALKNNRLYSDIDPDLFLRPGPRLVSGLEEIHSRLYQ